MTWGVKVSGCFAFCWRLIIVSPIPAVQLEILTSIAMKPSEQRQVVISAAQRHPILVISPSRRIIWRRSHTL
jgi:hypothetical protein